MPLIQPFAFWRFSIATYRATGVEPACLALQDRWAADTNLLLYCCWVGQSGRALDKRALRRAMRSVARWQAEVIQPLRRARRALKQTPQGPAVAWAGALRKRVGALELECEYLEQRMLSDAAADLPSPKRAQRPQAAAAASLERYLSLLGVPLDAAERRHVGALLDACDSAPHGARR